MSQICLILCISTDITLVQACLCHLSPGPAPASPGLQASTPPSPILCTQESAWAFQNCHSGYVIPLLKTLLPIFLWIKVKHGTHPCLCLNVCLAWHSLSYIFPSSFHTMHPLSCKAPTTMDSDISSNVLFFFKAFVYTGPSDLLPNFQGDSIFSSFKSQLKLHLLREAFSEHPSQGSPHPRIPSQPQSLTSHLLLPAVFIVYCLLMCSFNLSLTH